MAEKSIHSGHRQRLRSRIENESMDHFEEHEVLETLLYYVERQGDTNALAHRLLDYFGSLSKVLDANRSALEQVEGVGENVSFFLHLIPQICRRYMLSRSGDRRKSFVNNSDQAHEVFAPYFVGRTVETLYMLTLNSLGEMIACTYISEGSVNSTSLNIRKIIQVVLDNNASAVILCHNHPGGIAAPSAQDVDLTKKLTAILRDMDVVLLDHLIIVDGDFVSFRDSQTGKWVEADEFGR